MVTDKTKLLVIFVSCADPKYFKWVFPQIAQRIRSDKINSLELNVFWNKNLFNPKVVRVLGSHIKQLQSNDPLLQVKCFIPPCLKRGAEKILKFAQLGDCKHCVFKKNLKCRGMTLIHFQVKAFGIEVEEALDFSYASHSQSLLKIEEVCLDSFAKEKYPASWVPRSLDISRIVDIAYSVKSGKGKPVILDVGCGQGFLSYLLAKTSRAKVIGVEFNEHLVSKTKFRHPALEYKIRDILNGLGEFKGEVDLVFNSGMPHLIDFSEVMRQIGAPVIVYALNTTMQHNGVWRPFWVLHFDQKKDQVFKKHMTELSFEPGKNYKKWIKWKSLATSDLHRINQDKRLFSEQIEVHLRKDVSSSIHFGDPVSSYSWEKEMQAQNSLPSGKIEYF